MPNGSASSTDNGRLQRSYWAERIRNTMTMANMKAMIEARPVRFSWNAWPVHAM